MKIHLTSSLFQTNMSQWHPSIHLSHLFCGWHMALICIWGAHLTACVLGPMLALQGWFSPSKGSDGYNWGVAFHVQKLMAGYSDPCCLWKLQRHAFKQYPQCRASKICELYQNSMTCVHILGKKKKNLTSQLCLHQRYLDVKTLTFNLTK